MGDGAGAQHMSNGQMRCLPAGIAAAMKQIGSDQCDEGQRKEKWPPARRVGDYDLDFGHDVGVRSRRLETFMTALSGTRIEARSVPFPIAIPYGF